jgi:hypothetical protein
MTRPGENHGHHNAQEPSPEAPEAGDAGAPAPLVLDLTARLRYAGLPTTGKSRAADVIAAELEALRGPTDLEDPYAGE